MSPSQFHFSIQPCAPEVHATEGAADLAAAVGAIYPMDTEDAILNWNRVAVRVGYRYDVSVLIDDLLPLLTAVAGTPTGEQRVEWGSDTFMARWDVAWNGDDLRVTAQWSSISGDYHELLNERPTVSLHRAGFLAEWSGLLATVLNGIERSGVRLERADQLDHLRRLLAGVNTNAA